MSSGIYTALSGAVAQVTALDVTSSNIANANTTGYRTVRARFDEVLTRARARDQHMVRGAGTAEDTRQGIIVPTGNALDLALDGDGYLAVITPRGERYTRAGNLRVDVNSKLITADGLSVSGVDGKPISLPPNAGELSLREDGVVLADGNEVGSIKLVTFAPNTLAREGGTLYAPAVVDKKPAQPTAGPAPRVIGGALEHSAFSIVQGVVDLVKTSRTYEALHRAIESYKQIDERAARSLGGGG